MDKDASSTSKYDAEGYDKNGYNREGYNREGYNNKGYNKEGYDCEGYNQYGFDKEGYDQDGFDIRGYDKEGFGLTGYDKNGYDRNGINRNGLSKDDFDAKGFNKSTGFNEKGYNREGYDREGYDREGYNREGYNREGCDREGYNREGYNQEGYDREGYNRNGFNKKGFDRNGYNRLGYDNEGYDKNGYNQIGYDRYGYDKNGYDKNGKGRTSITNISQIKTGLRIRSKGNGQRGRVDGIAGKNVYYSLDNSVSTITTCATVDVFMNMFILDGSIEKTGDYRREGQYNAKLREYIYGTYRDKILIPAEKEKHSFERQSIIDNEGHILTVTKEPDTSHIWEYANLEARKIVNSAYFAHVDYKKDADLYIGKKSIPGYVIDWADKKAAYYYQHTIYVADQDLGINFVRDIELKDGVFFDYTDIYNKINRAKNSSNSNYAEIADKKLMQIIEQNRSTKEIHDIVESIQTKQYEIITQKMDDNSLVLGCAGSGKTMIMLHRIKYILYNNPLMDMKHMFIVSPTDILGRESRELSKILSIDQANQFTTAQFYVYTLNAIFEKLGLFHRTSEFKICEVMNSNQKENMELCKRIIRGDGQLRKQYINATARKLLNEKKQFQEFIKDEKMLRDMYRLYLASMKEMEGYSKTKITTIIRLIRERISRELKVKENRLLAVLYLMDCYTEEVGKDKNKNELDLDKILKHCSNIFSYVDCIDFNKIVMVETESKYKKTRFVQMISLESGEDKITKIRKLIDETNKLTYAEVDFLYNELDTEINSLKKLEEKQSALELVLELVDVQTHGDEAAIGSLDNIFENLTRFIDCMRKLDVISRVNPFDLFKAYDDIEKEIYHLKKADSSDDYVFDMLIREMGLTYNREERSIEIGKVQLKHILEIMLTEYNVSDKSRFYIFLDEFQDYSINELVLLRNYYGNSIFNLYGDVRQCIVEKGIDNIQELCSKVKFDKFYELQENYRNAYEITDYVNVRFGMNMYKIGLQGNVDVADSVILEPLNENDRAAIIVADESIVENLDIDTSSEQVFEYSKEDRIHKNSYNIITVEKAKGLEFERVIVIEKNMTRNQLYVACTRAIRDLMLVS